MTKKRSLLLTGLFAVSGILPCHADDKIVGIKPMSPKGKNTKHQLRMRPMSLKGKKIDLAKQK